MIRSGIRRLGRRLKRRVARTLRGDPSEQWASAPAVQPAPSVASAPVSPFAAEAPETPAPAAAAAVEAPDDVVGDALTVAQVQELFEDMVRPALQSDGGDIDLVKVEDNDVYVRLVGACSSCPSSTVTMKMGIERLLAEEFPQFRHLIQVA